jgi:hypothetical protein
MHISVVSIEGNYLDDVPEILRKCEYVIEDCFTVQTGDEASRQLDWNPDPNRVAKVAYFSNGWTFIVDPEMVLMSDDVWLEYSRKWKTRVVGWVCEGASGSYRLSLFESGTKLREVQSCAGEDTFELGKPLPEEANINWDEAWEDDVLEIVERLGAKYDFMVDREYVVFQLDESQMSVSNASGDPEDHPMQERPLPGCSIRH